MVSCAAGYATQLAGVGDLVSVSSRSGCVRYVLEDRMRRLGTNWHAAVAFLDGRPVGTARWFIHSDLRGVEFVGAETLSDYRRRGVYTTLVACRVGRAAREGCTFAGIIADGSTSTPILVKRDFKDLGRATFFLRPAPPA